MAPARLELLSLKGHSGTVTSVAFSADGSRLALGTQCGFATSTLGNAISVADQQRKLARIATAAKQVWGG